MAESTPMSMQVTSPAKRSYDGDQVPTSTISLTTPSAPSVQTSRQRSPGLSTTSSLSDPPPSTGQGQITATPSGPDTKKRKLTFAEREVERAVRQAEKEAKEREKAEVKARREEEKRAKDEEKRQKEEEKEAARRERELDKERKRQTKEAEQKAKDEEKALRDEEKKRKEEEKRKKEQSQLRIGAFFGRPAPASTPPTTPDDISSGFSSRRSSIAGLDLERPQIEQQKTPLKGSDYEKMFPPFFVFDNADIAPANRFLGFKSLVKEPEDLSFLSGQAKDVKISSVIQQFQRGYKAIGSKRQRLRGHCVRDLVDRINGTARLPIDLTSTKATNPAADLETVPMKFLSFKHLLLDYNVRPPYQGTFTRGVSSRSAVKIPRNPFHRGIPDTNYDYDSEAEWEPPQEGDEDIDLEDDASEDEADEGDMNDFLDDEGDVARRRAVVGEMEPVSSGVCWEGETSSCGKFSMQEFHMDVLDDSHQFPIDPHSTRYWLKPSKESPVKDETADGTNMQPPRLPLSSINVPNVFVKASSPSVKREGSNGTQSKPTAKSIPTKVTKTIPYDLLPAFKAAVSGSDMTKAGLIEVLKKQFPKCSKDAIKDTLSAVAVREGVKEADKKWVLVSQNC